MSTEVKIPELGESVSEGVIARWLKQNGEHVESDEPILELDTDKASMEIPADASGTLEILVKEGESVSVGDVVARIDRGGEGEGKEAKKPETKKREKRKERESGTEEKAERPKGDEKPKAGEKRREAPSKGQEKEKRGREAKDEEKVEEEARAREKGDEKEARRAPEDDAETPLSPAVRRLVEEHDLDPAEIPATGKGGRLTKGDVLGYLERGETEEKGDEETEAEEKEEDSKDEDKEEEEKEEDAEDERKAGREAKEPPPPHAPAGREEDQAADTERVPMTQLRRRIAERLVEAQQTAAILTTFNEIDLSEVMALRKRHKEAFEKRYEVPLGFMSIFARAVILALRELPELNARIDGTDIVYQRSVHLGVAVATDRGLLVPVVRSADTRSFADLEREIGRLATAARSAKIKPDELSGGTFTITNGGVFGSLLSTPILNPPQSGVLGMHKIEERPIVFDGNIVVRPMMYVALSYDHRIVDGREAVTFLVRVKERLEDPFRMLLEV